MKIRSVSSLLVIALLAVAVSARADEKAASTSAQRFEALKKLAGDWVEVGKDGKARTESRPINSFLPSA
jgi:hypothetical protein